MTLREFIEQEIREGHVFDIFTDRHPEYAAEIEALIDISKDDLEED